VFFSENGELYAFTLETGGGPLSASTVTPVSKGVGVTGDVIGASEDGSFVYFVSGGDDLYVAHYDGTEWKTAQIAVLSSGDSPDWGEQKGEGLTEAANLTFLTARVSPNGEYLAFMSQESLTGYDNRDADSGVPDEEVYEYHAPGNPGAEAGSLVCASCNPTGERPMGVFDAGLETVGSSPLLSDHPGAWEDHWLAGSLPGWTALNEDSAVYQSRYLSDSGRLFFNSADALVPADINGKENVYEYEPEGPGGCTSASENPAEVFNREADGCVGLISSGTSSEESAFLDASGVGPGGQEAEDVFFLTSSPLTSEDTDTAYDVYDAHICSTQSPCHTPAPPPPLPCDATESCRSAPMPQPGIFAAPSATITGAGNITPPPLVKPVSLTRAQKLAKALKACKTKPKSKRAACEKQARKAYGKKASRPKKH
jgi:hypothetical protein